MSRLFIKNIPVNINENKLKSFFIKAGDITDIRILKKKYLELIS